jgi:hypothetical protein
MLNEGRTDSTCPIEPVLQRIRSEFLEMPGLRLTGAQAGRLWNLDAVVCESLLGTLVTSQFLARRTDGAFVRSTDTIVRASRRIA